MMYNPDKHHRRSIRLKEYDYSQSALYFVTICAQNRACLFGEIHLGKMHLNSAGEMIHRWWNTLPDKFPAIAIDEFVIMPNHFHGIIIITDTTVGADMGLVRMGANLATVVQWFKTMTTNEYIRGVKNLGWQPFNKRLWQRNYYDHIIRNQESLQHIQEYIHTNPLKWEEDQLHPNVPSKW